jgi:hypothetical protein
MPGLFITTLCESTYLASRPGRFTPRYPLNRRPDRPQCPSGRYGERNIYESKLNFQNQFRALKINRCLSATEIVSFLCWKLGHSYCGGPIRVAARSKARNVFARSNTGIVGSNPTRGMDVCPRFFCVCVILCR